MIVFKTASPHSQNGRAFRSIVLFLGLFMATLIPTRTAFAIPESLITTPHTTVELISDRREIKLGEAFWVGIYFRLKPGWHIYFQNPGDSGLAPRVTWEGDSPRSLGPIQWPTPQIIPLTPLVNYGYTGEVLLPVKARLDPHPGDRTSVELHGQINWLVCEENCIPEKGQFSLTLAVNGERSIPSPAADLFEKTLTELPRELSPPQPFRITQSADTISLELPEFVSDGTSPYFFPSQRGLTSASAPQVLVSNSSGRKLLQMKKAPSFGGFKGPVQGILRLQQNDNSSQSYTVVGNPDEVAAAPLPLTKQTTTALPESGSASLLGLLVLALLGGLILNLMPCVLPVLSLKVLSLVSQACDSPKQKLVLAGCYAAGTISSLVSLAGVLLLLRAGGAQIGWGFQLQYPPVVGLLALFFFIVGLCFLGFFDVGERIAHHACQMDRKEGPGGAFLSGLLATIVATPCTAPFMGSAVGLALPRPWYEALSIFAALGLGIALPYVLLVLFPGLQRFLPRPGAWMITLKQLLAFPLFATSIWLLWILSVQRGGPGVILILISALIVFFGIWIGKGALPLERGSLRRRMWISIASFFTLAGFLIVPLPDLLSMQRGETQLNGGIIADAHGIVWQPYSNALIQSLQEQGETVYLDFTAAWCITCQVNKAIVFSDVRVQDYIKANKIKMIRGDWTNQDPAVTEALASFGRASVPLNVIYRPGSKGPIVLPAVLTPHTVLEALSGER